MDWQTGSFDSSRVEETYNWRDDVMEITRRIVHETDEARLSNIANHFEVDLSEIRAFLEMKQQQQQKPTTRGDRIRAMSDEELAEFFGQQEYRRPTFDDWLPLCYHVMGPRMCHEDGCEKCWLDWLKQEAT